MPVASTQQLVVFRLGNDDYALPIDQVQEVLRYSAPRAIASRIPWLRGLLSLRGAIIPVFDVGQRLGRGSPDLSEQAKILIAQIDADTTAGLIVDEVEEVLTVTADQLEEIPVGSTDLIEAAARIDDRLILILRGEHLVSDLPETAHLEESTR